MQIHYLTRQGELLLPENAHQGSHQENLEFLRNNHQIDADISRVIASIITVFLENVDLNGEGYLNSGQVAVDVCQKLGFVQDRFHHGLVGSALNREFGNRESNNILIASKGEGQTWFDYFVPQ